MVLELKLFVSSLSENGRDLKFWGWLVRMVLAERFFFPNVLLQVSLRAVTWANDFPIGPSIDLPDNGWNG